MFVTLGNGKKTSLWARGLAIFHALNAVICCLQWSDPFTCEVANSS